MLNIAIIRSDNKSILLEWKCGQVKPCISIFDKITGIEANFAELHYIKENFMTIPYNATKDESHIQLWRGDFADFIARNL